MAKIYDVVEQVATDVRFVLVIAEAMHLTVTQRATIMAACKKLGALPISYPARESYTDKRATKGSSADRFHGLIRSVFTKRAQAELVLEKMVEMKLGGIGAHVTIVQE